MAVWALPQLSHQLSVAGRHSTSLYDLSHLTSGKKGLDQIFLRPTLAACDLKISHLPCAWEQSSKSTEPCSASAPNSVSSREAAIWACSSKDFMSCEALSGPGKITVWMVSPRMRRPMLSLTCLRAGGLEGRCVMRQARPAPSQQST